MIEECEDCYETLDDCQCEFCDFCGENMDYNRCTCERCENCNVNKDNDEECTCNE